MKNYLCTNCGHEWILNKSTCENCGSTGELLKDPFRKHSRFSLLLTGISEPTTKELIREYGDFLSDSRKSSVKYTYKIRSLEDIDEEINI